MMIRVLQQLRERKNKTYDDIVLQQPGENRKNNDDIMRVWEKARRYIWLKILEGNIRGS